MLVSTFILYHERGFCIKRGSFGLPRRPGRTGAVNVRFDEAARKFH